MTLPCDTLVCDTARVAYWQSDQGYDYNRELMAPELNFFGWLNMQLGKLLSWIFGTRIAEEYSGLILVLLFVALVLLLLWFLYRKRPELFMRTGKRSMSYIVREDTIYGVDFQAEIDATLSRSDFREAIRLVYLQTLKLLSDNDTINWQLYKTPTDYIYEVKAGVERESFRDMTNRFLRVRYGNFDANAALFNEMRILQQAINGGEGNERK